MDVNEAVIGCRIFQQKRTKLGNGPVLSQAHVRRRLGVTSQLSGAWPLQGSSILFSLSSSL